jgi:hypothetical protein
MAVNEKVRASTHAEAYGSYMKNCTVKTHRQAVRAADLLEILDQLRKDLGNIPAGSLPPDILRVYITADTEVHKNRNPDFPFFAPGLQRVANEAFLPKE